MYTKLDEITPNLQKAFLNKEDRWFYWHFGINPISVGRAFLIIPFSTNELLVHQQLRCKLPEC
jgi:membrane carboxypeptidase/penicillin-binding protein PbpC